jgi:DNA-binding IclR family transcriptional regulator
MLMLSPKEPQDQSAWSGQRSEGTVQSVDRAMLLLERLALRGGCAGLSDLARDLGLSRSTVHGLLATLQQHGIVAQEANRNYILGIKLFELGNQAVSRLDLRRAAGPVLQRLVDEFQETVHLVLGDGLEVVYIDKRESPHSMQIVSRVGQRLPAYCTAVGKAMLSVKPEAELDRLLAGAVLTPRTFKTITDKEQLKEQLAQIRRQGFALDCGEFAEGLVCVGAPIWDYTNQVVAAMSISGPSVRMRETKVRQAIQSVMSGAAEISHQLGYRGAYPTPERMEEILCD